MNSAFPDPSPTAFQAGDGISLLNQLQQSLEQSQRALLHRDVASLEQATEQQLRFCRDLSIWLQPVRLQHGENPVLPHSGLDEAIESAQRILQQARVQAALLRRAHRFLKMLSYLALEAPATYHPASYGIVDRHSG